MERNGNTRGFGVKAWRGQKDRGSFKVMSEECITVSDSDVLANHLMIAAHEIRRFEADRPLVGAEGSG